jgi:hypothetical protein
MKRQASSILAKLSALMDLTLQPLQYKATYVARQAKIHQHCPIIADLPFEFARAV